MCLRSNAFIEHFDPLNLGKMLSQQNDDEVGFKNCQNAKMQFSLLRSQTNALFDTQIECVNWILDKNEYGSLSCGRCLASLTLCRGFEYNSTYNGTH